MSMWMVRAGRGGVWADLFLAESCVGVDFWSESFDSPPTGLSREELATALEKVDPELSKGKRIVAAGQFIGSFTISRQATRSSRTTRIAASTTSES